MKGPRDSIPGRRNQTIPSPQRGLHSTWDLTGSRRNKFLGDFQQKERSKPPSPWVVGLEPLEGMNKGAHSVLEVRRRRRT